MIYITNILEAYLMYYLFKHVLPEEGKKGYQYTGMVLSAGFITAFSILGLSSTTRGILVLLVQIIYAVVCFGGNMVEKICWGSSFTLIILAADRCTFHVADIMKMVDRLHILLEPGWIREQMMVVYMLISVILTVVVSKINTRRFWLAKKHMVIMVFLVVSGMAALDWLLDLVIILHDMQLDDLVYYKISAACFLIQIILVLVFYLIIHMGGIYYQKQKLEEQRLMDSYELKEYEMLKDSAIFMRTWKHDIKNRIEGLKGCLYRGSKEEALQYLDDMFGELDRDLTGVGIDNTVLNAIVSSKKSQAEDAGIRFQYQIAWSGKICMTDPELATVMGNLLDNAIEACLRLPEYQDRYIHLEMKSYHRMVKITVENSYDGILKQEGKRLLSRKKEAGHGLGNLRIRKLVEMRGGFYEFEGTGYVFKTNILISEEKKDATDPRSNR